MAITFFTQSRKQIAPVWIRYRELSVDAKARTSLYIDKDRLKGSKVLKHKMSSKDNAEEKLLIKEKNKALDKVQSEMQLLEVRIRSLLSHTTQVDSKWLKQALRPPEEVVRLSLLDYYQELLNSNVNLSNNTQKSYKVNASFMLRYQEHIGKELMVSDIDGNFKDAFVKHCRDNGYPESTLKSQLGRLKAVCLYAEERGETIHNQVKNLSKGIKIQPTESVFLTPSEISDIITLKLKDKPLGFARDWLVISCYIGQRSASLFRLSKENIDIKTNTIRLTQVKTRASVVIPILPQVSAILKKHKGDFPPLLSSKPKHNYNVYNDSIKEVCRLAKIDEMCKGRIRNIGGAMSRVVTKPKHELVTSHVGRRSFASNFYGKLNQQLIMGVTGHKSESSFLKYINKDREIDAEALNSAFLNAM
jgi:integrase